MKRVSKFLLYLSLPLWVQVCLLGCATEDAPGVSTASDLGLARTAAPDTLVVPGIGRVRIQHVGLPSGLVATAGVPPSGEGLAPIIGAGGDGLPVVTGSGVAVGGVTGPGAVRWHGGQWLIPYGATPGSTITNMFCDVIPNATSTDTMELVGAGGVIGTATVPAATGIVVRAWILPANGGYTVPDGGPIVVRHSPRDSVTGAWTSAVQDLTVIGCAARTATTRTIPIAINGPRVGASPGFQGDALYMSGAVQSEVFQIAGVPVGSTITGARIRVRDSASGPTRLQVQLIPSVDGSQGPPIAASTTSAGTGLAQTLPLTGLSTAVDALTTYSIYVNNTTGTAQCSVVAIDIDYREN